MKQEETLRSARLERPAALRAVRAPACAHCGSTRHPTAAHEDLGQALLAAKRAFRAGRLGEAEAFVDVARQLHGGR